MIKVKNLLPFAKQRLITAPDTSKLLDLADILSKHQNHMVVVINGEGKMQGIVTRREVVKNIRGCHGQSCSVSCLDVIQKDVISCIAEDCLEDVWSIMKMTKVRNMPVIDADNKPIGLISNQCVLEELLQETEIEEQLLKEYVMCTGYR